MVKPMTRKHWWLKSLRHSSQLSPTSPRTAPFSGIARSDFRSPFGLFFTLVSYPTRLAGLRDGRCQVVRWIWGKGETSFWGEPKPSAWARIRELYIGVLGIWFFDFHFSSLLNCLPWAYGEEKRLTWEQGTLESFGLTACLSFPSGPPCVVLSFELQVPAPSLSLGQALW